MVVGSNKSTLVSAFKSTNISTVVRKKLALNEEILKALKTAPNPLSTSDLSAHLNKAWHTIDRACLMLQIEGKLDGFKIGKMNLWKVKQ
jgi:hypothetical protein